MTTAAAPSARRRPGRPAGLPGGASRRELLAAARGCFVASGYAGTSTRMIAADAAMTPANLRHHLGTKAEVFAAVYDDCMATVRELLETVGVGAAGEPARPGDVVRSLGALFDGAPLVTAFLAMAPIERSRHPELRTPLGSAALEADAALRSTLRHMAAGSRLADGVNPDVLADVMIAAVFGLVVYVTTIDPGVQRDTAVETLARLVDGQVWAVTPQR